METWFGRSLRVSLHIVLVAVWIGGLSGFGAWAQESSDVVVTRSEAGDSFVTSDGRLVVTNVGKKQHYDASQASTYDKYIWSPKSAAFHPDGSRFYVNSLEGCCTIVYDAQSLKRLKVINHRFSSGRDSLWARPSSFYPWTHYPDGDKRQFEGKPVEMAFSHRGRYLWVPYYRRTFDINAQDPSAVAVIDTKGDSIVRMFETGPLPKMVTVSDSGTLLAISHWGDNTVGFIDISSARPEEWRHLKPVTVGKKLELDFPLDEQVNRDTNSGYLLRGSVFVDNDRYLLVGCMAGGIAVIDVKAGKHVGFIENVANVRHLVKDSGSLYATSNIKGAVNKIGIDALVSAIDQARRQDVATIEPEGWVSCRVGKGARTLELSADGRYLFVACNFASQLHIVDAQSMRSVGAIRCDSYPVGLCVSPDGRRVVVTSQGIKRQGGNAVNVFKVMPRN